MSKVAVNQITNQIDNTYAENFVYCFKKHPKAAYIPLADDDELINDTIEGFPRRDLSGVLLVDLPRKNLNELVGIPMDFGSLLLNKLGDSNAYILAGGYDEPDYILVYSARL